MDLFEFQAKELFRRFGKDQCPAYAAALSFFSILSIVPLLVVALAALAYLFQDPAEATRPRTWRREAAWTAL